VRKDLTGNQIKLEEILSSIEQTSLQQMGDAIKAKDGERAAPVHLHHFAGSHRA